MSKTEKTAAVITLIILLSNVIGFLREMLLAKYFGATYIIDAYLMAQSIPFFVLTGFMPAIATSFVPLYSKIKEEYGFRSGNLFTSGVINMTFLIAAGLALIGFVFADPIVSVIAYGFSGQTHLLTVQYVRIGFMVACIFSVNEIVKTFLHCNEGFIYEKSAGLMVNVVNIIVIALSAMFNYTWLMYGYLLGYGAHLLLCLYAARLKGFRYRINLPDRQSMKSIVTLVLPVFIGSTAGQINGLVDKFLASGLSEGSVSLLGYAGTVNGMLMTIFTAALYLMIYPNLSKHIAKSDIVQFKAVFSRAMNLLIVILTPLTFGVLALAEPGIAVLYQRGQFGPDEVLKTAGVLSYFSVGMLGAGINSLISKAFYATQDSKTPMQTGFLMILLNITFSLLLIKPMAYNGLALASSLAGMLVVIPNALLLRKRVGPLNYRQALIILMKSTGAALMMSVAAYQIYHVLAMVLTGTLAGGLLSQLVALLIAVGAGIIIYLFLLWLLRVKEVAVLLNSLIKIKQYLGRVKK
ncbi:MAG: murein biosynthesis integral membrane protein MurJ [Desulfotomaculaceae bacterium]|nr:murein biosynthesis integral membrane protein MurJ [Desulfotomaculaceae bacterium]